MKYYSLLILFLANAIAICGQNNSQMIPSDAGVVIKFSGSSLNKKMSVDAMDQLPVIKSLLKEFYPWDQRDELRSMKDFGIDFTKDSYMFSVDRDSISIFHMVYPLADVTKLEANSAFNFTPEAIKDRNFQADNVVIKWDDKNLTISMGEINPSFIMQDKSFKTRYGFGTSPYDYGYNDNYYDEPVYEEQVEVYTEDGNSYYDKIEEEVEVEESYPETVIDAAKDVAIEEPEYNDQPYEAIEEEIAEVEGYTEPYNYEEQKVVTEEYQDPYARYYHLKDSVTQAWLMAHTNQLSMNKGALSNQNISDVINSKSDASFYADYSSLMMQYFEFMNMGEMMGMGYLGGATNLLSMYNGMEVKGDLLFDEDEINMTTEFITQGENAGLYADITDKKFNKKMLKHMDLENMLGYYSMSFNSEALLNFYPKIIGQFAEIEPSMHGMGSAVADIISVTLDEEAIAKIMTGNVVMLCDGFTKQNVSYKSYDYDENFNRVEVTRESEETLPSFLMMIESENFKTIKNWMDLGVRESAGIMEKTSYGYSISANNDIPMMVHMIFKDNIIYICNDGAKMENIVAGRSTGSSTKEHKKLLTKNNAAMYVDAAKVLEVVPFPVHSEEDQKAFELLKSSFKDIKIKQYQKSKNSMVSELILTGPDGIGNSWSYFWQTFNEFYTFSQR